MENRSGHKNRDPKTKIEKTRIQSRFSFIPSSFNEATYKKTIAVANGSNIGSIVKKGNYYHWRYRDVNGRTKSKVVKNSSGGKVLDRAEAELIVEQWAKDLFALQQLKSKEQVIRHIAFFAIV